MLTSQFVDVNARSESKLHLTSVSPCALYVLASPEFYKGVAMRLRSLYSVFILILFFSCDIRVTMME